MSSIYKKFTIALFCVIWAVAINGISLINYLNTFGLTIGLKSAYMLLFAFYFFPIFFSKSNINIYTIWYIFFLLIFTIFAWISISWSGDISYGYWKLQLIAIQSIIILALVSVLNIDEFFIKILLFFVFLSGLFFFLFTHSFVEDIFLVRYAIFSNDIDPITLSRSLGTSFLICLWLIRTKEYKKYLGILFPTLLIIGTAMLAIGERGPILAATIASLFYFGFNSKNNSKFFNYIPMFIGAAFALIIIIQFSNLLNPDFFDRFTLNELSKDGRWSKFDIAFKLFNEHPVFGSGLGGFASGAGGEGREYAHNLFLEVLVEMGIIGFIMLLLICIYSAVFIINNRSIIFANSTLKILFSIFLFYFVNSMVSGDLAINCLIFVWVFLIINATYSIRSMSIINKEN